MKELVVGDRVIYTNPHGREQEALLTMVWSQTYVNLVFVSENANKTDSCGRQIEHETSVPIYTEGLPGRYFRRP